jgi:hypothetical protein
MPDLAQTVRAMSILACLSGLSGCRSWQIAEAPPPCRCTHGAVLAELGISEEIGAPVASRVPGPSLIAGDSIAWKWAIAFGHAPRSETPAGVYASVTTD